MQLLSLVMLNVLDEKWKDHLYDLDQLRAAIQYRSWGQTDPLIEYKKEAYTMFVDLMNDVYHTFTERFLRAQLVFDPGPGGQSGGPSAGNGGGGGGGTARGADPARRPTRQYNALGILEDVAEEPGKAAAEPTGNTPAAPAGASNAEPQPPRKPPKVVGAGRTRTLGDNSAPNPNGARVGRNDPCPCGSGKKYKKCHGATV
jgi:preprotein translocase subunit SecA